MRRITNRLSTDRDFSIKYPVKNSSAVVEPASYQINALNIIDAANQIKDQTNASLMLTV